MKLSAISRRKLLIASGLSGATLFLPSMLSRGARAKAASEPIKRLVILIQEHGTVRSAWRMPRNNKDYGTWEYPFDDSDPMSFSEILRPLHGNRDDLLVVEGLAMSSSLGDRAMNNHNSGHLHLLTGAKMLGTTGDATEAGGPSVDQIIAKQIARPDRIPSLELATGNPWLGGFINSAPGVRVPVQTSPSAVFQRLFPTGFDSGSMPSERDLIRAAHGSVLDLVQDEYDAIAPKLSGDDRKKLELHRDQIRDLETRQASLANLKCGAPAEPERGGDRLAQTRAYADIVAAAFACDLTRVATIAVTQLDNDEFGAPAGDVHQDFAHLTDRDANAAKYMTQYNKVHAELFNYLIDSLKKYSDGEGTLLDNTACIWITELATGPHARDQMPIVMAGKCAGEFKVGRYVSYPQDQPNATPYPDSTTKPVGPAHTRWLISLMNAFGVEGDTLGMTSVQTKTKPAQTVDLTGALDRLK
jgi:hypothetical protein